MTEWPNMDDVVAVPVELSGDGTRYFLSYGRIVGDVDAGAVEAVVLEAPSDRTTAGRR
jgi:hypothetical protein